MNVRTIILVGCAVGAGCGFSYAVYERLKQRRDEKCAEEIADTKVELDSILFFMEFSVSANGYGPLGQADIDYLIQLQNDRDNGYRGYGIAELKRAKQRALEIESAYSTVT